MKKRVFYLAIGFGLWLLAAAVGSFLAWEGVKHPLLLGFLGLTEKIFIAIGLLGGGAFGVVSETLKHSRTVEQAALIGGTASGLLGSKAVEDLY